MDEFLSKILKILKELNIKPVIYGSFSVAVYLGNFKNFEDIDILIEDEFVNNRWIEFRKLFEIKGFNLINEKEHEFELEGKKVGFASRNILIRDKIINDYRELIQYKNTDAFTLTPEDFLKAYKFSIKDGYRINTRGKKDESIIKKLEIYIKNMQSESLKLAKDFLGKEVKVVVDRPLGSKHPKYGFIYEVNYGYIEGIIAPDGEELDAYLLGITKPIKEYIGICIAIAHRKDNDDDKLIVVPQNMNFNSEEIMKLINFQEKWFNTEILFK